jgi:glycosyltransferase involved in cell wall biosynthesis
MKILQIHNKYKIRGGECGVVDAEYKLLTDNCQQVIQYIKNNSDLDNLSTPQRIKALFSIRSNNNVKSELEALVASEKPDVAHVHNIFPMLSPIVYKTLNRLGIPIVQTLHNYRFLCPNGTFFTNGSICEDCQLKGFSSAVKKRCVRDNLVISYLYASAIKTAWQENVFNDCITRHIALNHFVKDKMIAGGIAADKIDICGNFIWDNKSHSEEKDNYILYLGRLSPEKGVETLIKAVLSLDNVHLKIAGTGPDKEKLQRLGNRASGSTIEFVGYVSGDEKVQLIKKALCTVIPSEWYENFPMSVLESLSLGTPVIASKIGGLPDMIKEGETGMFYKTGDIKDLAKTIQNLLSDRENTQIMSKNSIDVSRTTFSQYNHLETLLKIYKKSLA